VRCSSEEMVTIVGAGPAGMAAAIQLRRSGIDPLLVEESRLGGLLINANLVENYPGFPQGISGPELVRLFSEQLARVGVQPLFERVLELDHDGGCFLIRSENRVWRSRTAVIASGTRPRRPEIPLEVPGRVFYEVAPLAGVKGGEIAVVGSGDAAFDYSLNLARHNRVLLLIRGERAKCLGLLEERVASHPAIELRRHTIVRAVREAKAGRVLVELVGPGGGWEVEADYVIFAIGREARLEFLSPAVREGMAGLQREGVLYMAGDVGNDIYRQASIAVGDGVRAAMMIHRRLQGAI